MFIVGNTISMISLPADGLHRYAAAALRQRIAHCGLQVADRQRHRANLRTRVHVGGSPQVTSTSGGPVRIVVLWRAIVSPVYVALPPAGKLRFCSVPTFVESSGL